MKVLLLLTVLLLIMPIQSTSVHKRSSGFERLRDRIHRKRHRQQKASVLSETDELFEMSSSSSSSSNFNDDSSRVRSEKSIPTTGGTMTTQENTQHHHSRHHHNHHKKIHHKSNRRERNEDLCQSQRKTVELNTQSHEFDPPFIVEVRCLNTPSLSGILSGVVQEQTCVKGMLRCVQQYSDVHVSRRSVGSIHWHPYTIQDIPISCQCMWPTDKYGHQEF